MPDFCTLELETSSYAVPYEYLREVIEPLPITSVPLTPPGVRGVVNLRGDLVPVLTLDTAVGLLVSEDTLARRPWMAFFRDGAQTLGLLVNGVGTLRNKELEPLPDGIPSAFLMEGSITSANAKLPILNLRALVKHLSEGLKQSAAIQN